MTALLVLLGGAVGAPSRWFVDGFVRTKHDSPFPWGTFVINASGSFVLGVVLGSASAGGASHHVVLLIGTGFCGAFTTFSTFGFETVRLAEERYYGQAVLNIALSLGGGLLLAVAGWSVGHAVLA
jgi:CrcB protein